jgi:hypothetical protein
MPIGMGRNRTWAGSADQARRHYLPECGRAEGRIGPVVPPCGPVVSSERAGSTVELPDSAGRPATPFSFFFF